MRHRKMFHGADYQEDRDFVRLARQATRVWDVMIDGEWHTLRGISVATGDPEASVSAQLRNFRKPSWGSHTVHRAYKGDGLYIYKLRPNPNVLVDKAE
jgi:hypothetical protein